MPGFSPRRKKPNVEKGASTSQGSLTDAVNSSGQVRSTTEWIDFGAGCDVVIAVCHVAGSW